MGEKGVGRRGERGGGGRVRRVTRKIEWRREPVREDEGSGETK